MMATFVLIGGAWIGSWAWTGVTDNLRRRGHAVFPLSLTGLAERVHLARPDVDLETHITDVINLIEFDDLQRVSLVGHSYAGSVVAGVADRIGHLLSQVIYCDTAPLENGESVLDFMHSLGDQGELQAQVNTEGEGWKLPPLPFGDLPMSPFIEGLTDQTRQLMSRKAVPQPFTTYTQKLTRASDDHGTYQRVIIACNSAREMLKSGEKRFAQFDAPDWRIEHLDTGHWPMLSAPDELSDLLNRIVTG